MKIELNKWKEVFLRNSLVALISGALFYVMWMLNATWSADMRLWKALGGAAFILLWFTVFIGPAAKLWRPISGLISWRRETGVFFALIALIHGFLVLDDWVRWGAYELLGYKYIPELETYLRSEPGFGLANIMGLLALLFGLALAATSFDRAIRFLGPSSWKWLHSFTYLVFYLAALHALYFAFVHFTPSPERVLLGQPTNYPANPLRFYYLGMLISVFLVQISAFIKTVVQYRRGKKS